ncbi:MAG: 2-(1,2-epoxy-1,2-dihydrophenyl)acetyl-CoA isomerase [Dehalococcoidia bacterium]|nr:2-(1,2-epoxy-1,2-dihydrophenyl)acetyl-CoA isomerase [Dehalococcoidia bacterium]
MAYELLIFEKRGPIATITLNRPDSLNALNNQLRVEIVQCIDECGDDEEVRVVVVKGAGRAFCAGDDLRSGGTTDPPSRRKGPTDVVLAIRHLRKPVIAALQGFAFGAGMELAMACDFRIAAEGTQLAEPFVKRGIMYGGYLLPRYVGIGRATEMLLTGEPITVEEAESWGLVTRVVPADKLEATVEEWAQRFATAATLAIGGLKEVINQGLGVGIEQGFQYLAYESAKIANSEDRIEGVRAFREKRQPVFKGR